MKTLKPFQLTEEDRQRQIPFKYGYKKELKDILTDMGMGIAFTDMADFSNISEISLLISFVKHQAFIETNEEGTEAAAAENIVANRPYKSIKEIAEKTDASVGAEAIAALCDSRTFKTKKDQAVKEFTVIREALKIARKSGREIRDIFDEDEKK